MTNPPSKGASHFGKAVETAAFLEIAAGRARRSARAANVAKHALGLSGARGATRPTSPSTVRDRSKVKCALQAGLF
jgi:hypothetical protein